MKNLLNKKFSLAISSVMACAMPFALTSISSCANAKTIQFANFESYMDNSLMNYLEKSYNVQFQWYTVTEMIETKFHDTYDVAIPSGYELYKLQQKGWLEEIDWAKLGISEVTDADSAMNLFADPIQGAIEKMNNDLGINVLKYGIPYFAQSFTFVYKGPELKFYSAIGSHEETSEPTWADIFYTISPQCKYADRFGGKIGMLDDSKTLYDIARIVETIEQNPDDQSKWTNQMPQDSSINSLKQTFKSLTNKARRNWYRLSTDSGQIARILADHSEHGYNAALAWSGDALYGAQGAGEYSPYKGDQMHTIKPSGVSLDEIDFIVLNNKNHSNSDKLNRIYKMIYDICFDAWQVTDEDELLKTNADGKYKYWSMQNWDTVSYIPLLKNIYNNVTSTTSKYWDYYASTDDLATRQLMTSLITLPPEEELTSIFGKPLSALQNSNTHWAWLETRGNL